MKNVIETKFIQSIIIRDELYQYATKKDRWVSGIIDRIICFLIALILTIIPFFIGLSIINNLTSGAMKFLMILLLILISLLFLCFIHFCSYFLYYGLTENKGKQTLGKKIRKIKSYDLETHEIAKTTKRHILLRYCYDMIIIYYFVPNEYNQYRHDKESNIVVLKKT